MSVVELSSPAVADNVADGSVTSSAVADGAVAGRPLAEVVGADTRVPLVRGGTVRYANLDYAASAPALRAVADRIAELLPLYASVHRGAGYASEVCTRAYEDARRAVASFAGARDGDVVVFTRHTTDALNLLATVVPGPVVHLDIEHHANLLPWQTPQGHRGRRGARGRVVTARPTVAATLDAVRAELDREPAALLSVTGASNVTGECLPLAELAQIAHSRGARLAVDGAQLAPHRRVDIAAVGIDYLALSGHKLYAPYGAGALIGRRDWLDTAPPYLAGGGAVREVRLAERPGLVGRGSPGGRSGLVGRGNAAGETGPEVHVTWADAPARHEGGTPNVIGAVALAEACRVVGRLGEGAVTAHEEALGNRLSAGLSAVGGVRILRLWPDDRAERIGVVSFVVDDCPAALAAQYLSAEHGIGVRDGKFCAHPLLARLSPAGNAVRASFGLGSTAADADRLVTALETLRSSGPAWSYADADGGYRPLPDPRPLPAWLTSTAPGAA